MPSGIRTRTSGIMVNIFVEPASGSYSAESLQFFARLANDPGATIKGYYNTMINALVAGGAWTGIDVLYIFATDTTGNAVINLKSATPTATLTNSPTFTAFRGYDGGGGAGTGQFVNTEYNPSTFGGSYTQNAASVGAWCLTGGYSGPGLLAVESADLGQNIFTNAGDGNMYARVNDNTETSGFVNPGDSTGFYFGVRTSATGRTGYRNGVSFGNFGNDDPSIAVINAKYTLPGSPNPLANPGAARVACFIAGGNLDSVQSTIYSAINGYMVSVGAA